MRKMRGYEVEAITIIETVKRKHAIAYIPSHAALESIFAILGGLNLRDDKQRGAFLATCKKLKRGEFAEIQLEDASISLLGRQERVLRIVFIG